MAKKLEWVFSLVDKMSGPAKKAENAIGGVEGKLEKVSKAGDKKPFRFLDGVAATSPRAKAAIERVSKPFANLKKAFADAGASSSPVVGKLGAVAGALGGVTMAAVAAAGAVAAVGAGLIAGASYMAIKAAFSRKDMLLGFEAVTGSGKDAVRALSESGELAKKIGISTGTVQKAYLDMLRLGVERRHAPVIAQGLADLAATMGDEREAVFGQLTDVVAKMSSSGKFDVAALKAVRTTLRTEDIESALAKRLGVVPNQVKKMLQAGKVSADEGIAALLETIQTQVNKGGALGTTAAKANQGIMSQFRIMRERFGDLFELVDISPLERAMAKVNEIFTSERGAAMVEKINLVIGKLFKLVEDAAPTALAWIGKGIDIIGGIVDKSRVVYSWLRKVFAGDRLAAFTRGLKIIGVVLAVMVATALAPFLFMIGVITAGVAALAFGLGYLGKAASWAFGKLWEYGSKAVGWVLGLKDRLVSIGSDLVSGLWEGIKAGWRWMLGRFEGLLDLLPYAAKKALGIASPSKVMRELGGWTVEGFSLGLEDGARGASSAMAAVVSPPSVTASSMARPAASAPVNVVNHFQIDGAQDPQATAAAIQDIAITSIASALEQLGIQSGAPVPV